MSGPKVRFKKEYILEKTYEFIIENGIEQVNARELAKYIGCSTQPIFRVFDSMNDLLSAVYIVIENTYNDFVSEEMKQNEIPFLGIGMGYIRFAVEVPNLFKALFMHEHFKEASMISFFETEESAEIAGMISEQAGLSLLNARKLLRNIWLLTHGIATMIAYNEISYSRKEIEEILGNGFRGFIIDLKEKNNE